MTKLKSILTAFMLATAASFTMAPSALAQGTVVVVIDEGRILTESKAAKDMVTKLKNIEAQINAELKPTRDTLEAQRTALAAKVQNKTPEAISADAALVNEIKAFQTKSNEFAQKRNILSQEYAATEQKAMIELNKALEPVLLEVVKEKNAQVVLSKSQAIFTADSIDASAAIIAKLDVKTPAITVVRVRAPAPQ
jgi:Skp family chaperone for outer membrane proteins